MSDITKKYSETYKILNTSESLIYRFYNKKRYPDYTATWQLLKYIKYIRLNCYVKISYFFKKYFQWNKNFS